MTLLVLTVERTPTSKYMSYYLQVDCKVIFEAQKTRRVPKFHFEKYQRKEICAWKCTALNIHVYM